MGVCDNDGYQVIEYFAGVAEIARLAKGSGWKAAERDSLRIHTVGIDCVANPRWPSVPE